MASLGKGPDDADPKPSPVTDRQPGESPETREWQEAEQGTTSGASVPSAARDERRDEDKNKDKDRDRDEDDRSPTQIHDVAIVLPRIKIKYCTQCRWMLRAAYVRAIQNDQFGFLLPLQYQSIS